MSRPTFNWIGTSALLAGIFAWGSMPVFLRGLSSHVDAFTANGTRYPFAALLYWPCLVFYARRGTLDAAAWKRAIPPAIASLCGQIFFALTPYYLEANVIGFLIKSAVVWVLIGAMIFFPEERGLLRSPRFWIGLPVAVAGFVWLSAVEGAFDANVTGLGVIFTLICGFFFACYGVCVRMFLRDVPPMLGFGMVSQFVATGTLVGLFVAGDPGSLADVNFRGWTLLLLSALIGIGISHALYFVSIKHLGATLSSAGHLLGPFVTAALASLFLSETLTTEGWIAGCVMVAGGGVLISAQRALGRPRSNKRSVRIDTPSGEPQSREHNAAPR